MVAMENIKFPFIFEFHYPQNDIKLEPEMVPVRSVRLLSLNIVNQLSYQLFFIIRWYTFQRGAQKFIIRYQDSEFKISINDSLSIVIEKESSYLAISQFLIMAISTISASYMV